MTAFLGLKLVYTDYPDPINLRSHHSLGERLRISRADPGDLHHPRRTDWPLYSSIRFDTVLSVTMHFSDFNVFGNCSFDYLEPPIR